jgi:hypothetical protein
VIGNPPYIRQEEFAEIKPLFKSRYSTFNSSADLYVYFVDLAFSILKQSGKFTFIIPNKWMKAGYGKQLRSFLKQKEIHSIVDFGDLPVFEEATTYPCILVITNTDCKNPFNTTSVETLLFPEGLKKYIKNNQYKVDKNSLSETGWSLSNQFHTTLIDKIRERGTPLMELENDSIFRGIVTGYNAAFVIDEATRNNIVAEDEKAAEILKPLLKGRDIKRYEQPISKEYLILAKRGIEIENYPSVYNHLLNHKEKLEKKAGGGKWYELQASPGSTDKFDAPKIMYPDISKNLNFILDNKGYYSVNTVYNIGLSSKGLLGFLNSKLFLFYFKTVSNSIRGGYLRFFTSYMEASPIPKNLEIFEPLVEEILETKKQNPSADTTALEAQIDQLVYQLYELTEEEIEIIENT